MARNDATLQIGANTRDAERALGKLQKNIKTLDGTMKKLAGAIGAVALARFTKNVLAASEALENAATKTGFTTDALQELRYAGDQAGISMTAVDTALQRFSRRTGEAANGTGVLKDEFAALGINIYNSDGSLRNINDTFDDYMAAIAGASSEQEKLRLAVAAFDMEGANFVNLVKDGATGLDDMRRAARAAGAVVSRDVIQANTRANASVSRLGKQFEALQMIIISGLAPSIERLSVELGNMLSNEESVENLSKAIANFGYVVEESAYFVKILAQNFDLVAVGYVASQFASAAGVFETFRKTTNNITKGVTDAKKALDALPKVVAPGTTAFLELSQAQQKVTAASDKKWADWRKALTKAGMSMTIWTGIALMTTQIVGWLVDRLRENAEVNGMLERSQDRVNAKLKDYSKLQLEAAENVGKRLQAQIALLEAQQAAFDSGDDPEGVSMADVIEKQKKKLEEINKVLAYNSKEQKKAREEAEKHAQAVITAHDSIKDQLKSYNEQIAQQALLLQYEGEELFVQQEILKIKLKLAETGLSLNDAQEKTLRNATSELYILQERIKLNDEFNQSLDESVTRYQEIMRQADGRITAEQTRIDSLIAIENAYLDGRLQSTEDFEIAKQAIENTYREQKYQAEEELINKLSVLQLQKLSDEQKAFLQKLGQEEKQKQIAADRIEFEKKSEAEKVQFAIQQGAEMFGALGQMNEKAFKAAKAFNIANAIMNTYTAATKALAAYPPPFNFIAMAAAIATGMAQVSAIRSQSYSGRAGGGPVQGGKPYIVGEQGREMFVPQGAGKIVPNAGGDTVNINFSIQANDTRGFDALLAERKPAIINMVRQAMNDKGNRATI